MNDIECYVETESSLIRRHKDLFLANPDCLMIEFEKKIPIFKWFISPKSTWEKQTVRFNTTSLLNKIAAAHREYPSDLIRNMLTDAAQRMRDISKGGMISNSGYEYIIEKAIELKDVTEVNTNTSIRFLNNPYFIWSKEDLINRKTIIQTHINRAINESITEDNYKLIERTLADYDLSQKRITKPILITITKLSLSTIKNYLNKYSELNKMFELVKENSGTDKQMKNKEYNLNKTRIQKVA